MDILFLITARGGSKSIPGKNLRQLGGLSLVGFKARAARKSKYCSRLIISTDSRVLGAMGKTVTVTWNGTPWTLTPGTWYDFNGGTIVVTIS